MPISPKNKRKFRYNETDFFWWVNEDFDGNGNMLSITIATADKKFIVKYFCIQSIPDQSYILVIGEYFPGLKQKKTNKIKLRCPYFQLDKQEKNITPANIREIISWCFSSPGKDLKIIS